MMGEGRQGNSPPPPQKKTLLHGKNCLFILCGGVATLKQQSLQLWDPKISACLNKLQDSSLTVFILCLRINHESGLTICGLAWNPKGNNEIAYTDNQVMVRDELTNLELINTLD